MDRTQQYPNQSDPRLGEVRAVLQRLQTFAVEPDAEYRDAEPKGAEHKSAERNGGGHNGAGRHGAGHARAAGQSGGPVRATRKAFGPIGLAPVAIAVAAASVLAGVTWLTISPTGHADQPPVTAVNATEKEPEAASAPASAPASISTSASIAPPASRPTPSVPAMEAVQELLRNGRVRDARRQLLGLVTDDRADVAWMLARSYDPNFLATIPAADAGPDVERAAQWYRAWHTAAVTQGLVPNSVSVERIIRSMR